jgi:hypothetical protein
MACVRLVRISTELVSSCVRVLLAIDPAAEEDGQVALDAYRRDELGRSSHLSDSSPVGDETGMSSNLAESGTAAADANFLIPSRIPARSNVAQWFTVAAEGRE